jgi:ferric iron reductase protein FhuF
MFFRLADPAADPAAGAAAGPAAGPAGWQPVRLLYGSHHFSGQPGAGQDHLDVLLEAVRAALGGCEPRVAASLFFQGYASRLLSPPLACLAVNGCIPRMTADRLRWRHPDDQMIELGLTAEQGWAGSDRRLIEKLVAASFEEHLQPLADALRRRVRISTRLLTGNAASALVSGVALLAGRLGPGWRSLAAHALAQPPLGGSGSWADNPGHMGGGEAGFVRRSCCLYYRVAGGGLCADCPLAARGVPPQPGIRP